MSSCLFCDIADGNAPWAPENVIIAANDQAIAKPALGQFVDGYTLIVAREHIRAFGEMSHRELGVVEELHEYIRAMLLRLYGRPVLTFEHGCGPRPDQRGGSCIDHAHLHVLPLAASVKDDLQRRFRFERVFKLADLSNYGGAGPYLYLETEARERFVFELDTAIPSQFMRRLICGSTVQPDVWDWRIHPFRDRIAEFTAAAFDKFQKPPDGRLSGHRSCIVEA
jgi:diadenosine tetraphosphate (Ap4A) HIT family hydrolase